MLNKYHFIPSAYVNSAQQSSLMYWFFSCNRYVRILIKAKLLSSATSSDSQRSLKSYVAKGDNYKVKAITILLKSKMYKKYFLFLA